MKISTVYTKGIGERNEDAIVLNKEEDIFAVIDGATGLGGLSGAIAANIIKESLEQKSDLTLLERVKNGNAMLQQAVEQQYENISFEQIPKYKRSSCGISAIHIHRDATGNPAFLEYVSAGDCMLFLQFSDDSIRQVTYDHIDRLDLAVISKIETKWRTLEGTEPLETLSPERKKQKQTEFRQEEEELLRSNRNKLNTYEGYGIIDGDQKADQFLESGKIPLIAVKQILLISDGLKLHHHRDHPSQNTWIQSAEKAFTDGLQQLEQDIIKTEAADFACIYYPRLKQHDDKSGILLGLPSYGA
ncbi:hypothetical protein [Cytobacillus gottheilii]|uniref:hypothetical protein n=1 Tax=Cytobacillus gottheilii TaxID=859144 RepID=UPI0009B963F5|nr:hypothetical protein [Cytobacillus gottheilii]